MPATLENQNGYFETLSLMDANDRILSSYGYSWDHPWISAPSFIAESSLAFLKSLRPSLAVHLSGDFWIDKDPRLCLTREAYRHVLLRAIPVVAIVRHPFEVAWSLYDRDGIALDRGLAIWALYNFNLLCRQGASPEVCFDFADFHDPAFLPVDRLLPVLQRLWRPWLPEGQSPGLGEPLIRELISGTYKRSLVRCRSSAQQQPLPLLSASPMGKRALEAWEPLQALLRSGTVAPDQAEQALAPMITLLLQQPEAIQGWRCDTELGRERLAALQALRAEADEQSRRLESTTLDMEHLGQEHLQLQADLDKLGERIRLLEGECQVLEHDRQVERERHGREQARLRKELEQARTLAAERRSHGQLLRDKLNWNRRALAEALRNEERSLGLLRRLQRLLAQSQRG